VRTGPGIGLAVVLAAATVGCRFSPAGELADDDDDGVEPVDGDDGDDGDDGAPAVDAAVGLDALTASTDAPPPCPADYAVALGGVRYVRRATATTIATARADCADDLAGRTALATFELAADLPAVLASVGVPNDDQLWVGATCAFTTFGCEGAASWTWDSGGPVAASLWAFTEPNNGFTELSAIVTRGLGGWQMASTGTLPIETHPYLCACRDP